MYWKGGDKCAFSRRCGAYAHSPLTKVIWGTVATVSILSGFFHFGSFLTLSVVPNVLYELELWRLFTYHFVCLSASEFLFSLVLLYFFRLFERLMGSRKFAMFALLAFSLGTVLNVAILAVLYPLTSSAPVALNGPYSLVYACFVYFWAKVPPTTRISILRVEVSEKVVPYIFGLQLLFSHPPGSFFAAISGVLVGLVYYLNVGAMNRFQFPVVLVRFVERHVRPLIEPGARMSSASRQFQQMLRADRGSRPGAPTGGALQGHVAEIGEPLPRRPVDGSLEHPEGLSPLVDDTATQPLPMPQEEDVQTLISMGFTRAQALTALAVSFNNLHVATNRLLEQQSS